MYPYLHYDVFTIQALRGQPAGDVHRRPKGMSAEQMQTITREMNFSETTFLLPAETPGTDIRMRIFTPGAELPMAGHPTIGSTFALADSGVIAAGRGAVRVRPGRRADDGRADLARTAARLRLDGSADAGVSRLPRRRSLDILPVDRLRDVDALDPRGLPIEEISCGVPFVYVPLSSRVGRGCRRTGPFAPCGRYAAPSRRPQRGVHVRGGAAGSEVTVYSRMFAPGPRRGRGRRHGRRQRAARLLPGDPSTGSRIQPGTSMVSLQGVKMGGPAASTCASPPSAQAITRVQVGGQAVKVGTGTIDVKSESSSSRPIPS